MVINNQNEFNGQTNFTQVNVINNYYINSSPPPVFPEPVPEKKKKPSIWKRYIPSLYSFIKWILKFLLLFFSTEIK